MRLEQNEKKDNAKKSQDARDNETWNISVQTGANRLDVCGPTDEIQKPGAIQRRF
jgi:hypothetical protein